MYKAPSKISGLKKTQPFIFSEFCNQNGAHQVLVSYPCQVQAGGLSGSERFKMTSFTCLVPQQGRLEHLGTGWPSLSLCLGRSSQCFSWCLPTKRIKKWELQSYLASKLGSHIVLPTSTAFFWSSKSQGQPKLRGRRSGLHFPMR